MTGNRKEHLWKEKIMKIRKTICSLLLVCLAFLGIFCGRANVYADQKQALSATVTLLKQEKDCVVQVEAKNSGADFPERCGWCFPVQTTPEAVHLNSA